jgi:hypothetical protein
MMPSKHIFWYQYRIDPWSYWLAMDEDQRIAAARSSIEEIHRALDTNPSAWQFLLTAARGAMTTIDTTTYMRRSDRLEDQLWLMYGLQRLACQEPDVGTTTDILEWCLRSWLVMLQNHPDNVQVLQGRRSSTTASCSNADTAVGIGLNWLSKAQGSLSRIHRQEASSSSSGGSTSRSGTRSALAITRIEDEREFARQTAEAEGRLGLPDYVEARAILLPATEYLSCAVDSAQRQGLLTGDLLSKVNTKSTAQALFKYKFYRRDID